MKNRSQNVGISDILFDLSLVRFYERGVAFVSKIYVVAATSASGLQYNTP
jgi:hypothetical protein